MWGSRFPKVAASFAKAGSQKFAYKFTFKPFKTIFIDVLRQTSEPTLSDECLGTYSEKF
jgi:hypothetical protein